MTDSASATVQPVQAKAGRSAIVGSRCHYSRRFARYRQRHIKCDSRAHRGIAGNGSGSY